MRMAADKIEPWEVSNIHDQYTKNATLPKSLFRLSLQGRVGEKGGD